MSTPSLAEATAQLVEVTAEFDRATARWWQLTPEEGADIAQRWWMARQQYRAAILDPAESRAS